VQTSAATRPRSGRGRRPCARAPSSEGGSLAPRLRRCASGARARAASWRCRPPRPSRRARASGRDRPPDEQVDGRRRPVLAGAHTSTTACARASRTSVASASVPCRRAVRPACPRRDAAPACGARRPSPSVTAPASGIGPSVTNVATVAPRPAPSASLTRCARRCPAARRPASGRSRTRCTLHHASSASSAAVASQLRRARQSIDSRSSRRDPLRIISPSAGERGVPSREQGQQHARDGCWRAPRARERRAAGSTARVPLHDGDPVVDAVAGPRSTRRSRSRPVELDAATRRAPSRAAADGQHRAPAAEVGDEVRRATTPGIRRTTPRVVGLITGPNAMLGIDHDSSSVSGRRRAGRHDQRAAPSSCAP
jgi:hypothetical protein